MQLGMPLHKLAGAAGLTLTLIGSVAAASPVAAQPMPQAPRGVPMTPHARPLMLSAMGHIAAPRGLGLAASSSSSNFTSVPLLVQMEGGAAALLQAGIAARGLTRSFAAVNLPPSELWRLWQLPGVRRIDGSRQLRPRLDRSM